MINNNCLNNQQYIKKYFPPPPLINSIIEYQDVNTDPTLRKLMTTFFLKKTIKWINNDKEFESFKNLLSKLENEGYDFIYKILRGITKKYKFNWFDLKYIDKYYIVKKTINKNLPLFI
jgi:hypothetical protein